MKIWERLLIVFVCSTFMLCGLTTVPRQTDRNIHASAAGSGASSVTLNYQQTLALFGYEIDYDYYVASSGNRYSRKLHLAGYSTDVGNTSSWAGLYVKAWNSGAPSIVNQLTETPYLVYVDNYVASMSSNDSTLNPNVYVQFPIDMQSISFYEQGFCYSGSSGYYVNARSTYGLAHTSFNSVFQFDSLWMTSGNSRVFKWGLIPLTKYNDNDIPFDENKVMYGDFLYANVKQESNENFSLSGLELTLNNCRTVDRVAWSLDDNSSGAQVVHPGLNQFILMVQCPTIGGYTPPATTTARTTAQIGSTASYNTFPTVDLSALESGVGTMVQMQDEGNYYERVQIDQLNTIIEQLNSIYNQMVQSGEIAVDLVPSDNYAKLGTDVLSDMDALTTYTMAQLPNVSSGATGLFGFVQPFTGLTWVLPIGLFSLGFSIFCWVLFRGRG